MSGQDPDRFSRPSVTVVMPFAGDAAAAAQAIAVLRALRTRSGDELILVDNSPSPSAATDDRVDVVRAAAEHSPAYARNIGAARARNDWILFLDADCHAPANLLDAYFASPAVPEAIGALAGEVRAAPGAQTLAERYGAARSFLGQQAHLAHPYRPRAVAANLMVRRTAFEQVGGFYEGVRAAEDTDFSWRLQAAGWRLEPRPEAHVEHSYRARVRDLRRQWRGYAAGRAWLARRYVDFEPEPALRRAVRRIGTRDGARGRRAAREAVGRIPAANTPEVPPSPRPDRVERARHLALDAVLGVDELAGLLLSNRPSRDRAAGAAAAGLPADGDVQVVLVADRFPAAGDPLVEFAGTLKQARVEALARPAVIARNFPRDLRIDYREDDGVAARWAAFLRVLLRHPLRGLRALLRRRGGPLVAVAPAVVRLDRDPRARLLALGNEQARQAARRLAELTGRELTAGRAN